MKAFDEHMGVAMPLPEDNINTDVIIPSREMRTVSKSGLAEGLFAPWRYLDPDSREENPSFAMNKAAYRCLLYTSPSPRDLSTSRMPSSA